MNFSNHGHLLSCEMHYLIGDKMIHAMNAMLEDYGAIWVARSALVDYADMMLMGAEMNR